MRGAVASRARTRGLMYPCWRARSDKQLQTADAKVVNLVRPWSFGCLSRKTSPRLPHQKAGKMDLPLKLRYLLLEGKHTVYGEAGEDPQRVLILLVQRREEKTLCPWVQKAQSDERCIRAAWY